MLLAIGLSSLPGILVAVLIVCIFLAVLYYCISKFLTEPLRGYVTAVVLVIAAVVLIMLLLPFATGK